jgi:hypothetical protein
MPLERKDRVMKVHTRDELHQLADELPDDCLGEAVAYLRWLLQGEDTITEDDLADARLGAEEIARGDYVTLAEFQRASEPE